jgi:ParB family chromosome partitioning protein
MPPHTLPLDALDPHPANSNVMSAAMMDKLAAHIRASGQYPPLIVRPRDGGRYQLLDGHHRAAVLRRLGHTHAHCVVWDADDAQALMLLATLNRLQGTDDPLRRAALIGQLQQLAGLEAQALARLTPESAEDLARLATLQLPPTLQPASRADDLPVAIHFFITPAQKRAIEDRLDATGLPRDRALCALLLTENHA